MRLLSANSIKRLLHWRIRPFCAEGIENVVTLSDFRDGEFGKNYGLELLDGPLKGLHARSVVVLDENHNVVYTELVPEIKDEPNYEKALAAL